MAPLPPDPPLPEPGSLVGCWVVGQSIVSHSDGTVLTVVHQARPQAGGYVLKLARQAGDERFEREAWLLSRIRPLSVPRLEDRGTWTSPQGEDCPYLVVRVVEGLGLYAWILEQESTLGRLARVTRALRATDFGGGWHPSAHPKHEGRKSAPRLALVGGCLVVALLCLLVTREVNPGGIPHSEPESAPHAHEPQGAGTALGEEGLAAASPAEIPQGSERTVSREIPDAPRPGQQRPPCAQRAAKVVNGGCWLPVGTEKPPCDTGLYEHAGRCYFPAPKTTERTPTSEEQR